MFNLRSVCVCLLDQKSDQQNLKSSSHVLGVCLNIMATDMPRHFTSNHVSVNEYGVTGGANSGEESCRVSG